MNGGNTTITRRAPYQALISPKALQWPEHTQVYAAVQNENVFNNALNNGRFGGFANVIQTFEMTESPRRLKPVNVYYHFYSADRFDAFTALKRVMEWCVKQDLHPITGSHYAAIVHDSIATSLYRKSERAFLIINDGIAQTFRIPQSMGYPDLQESKGILGFYDMGDQRYIHTLPQAIKELVFSDKAPRVPYLKQARASVTDFTSDGDALMLHIENPSRDPLPVILANMGNARSWKLIKGEDAPKTLKSNKAGELTFNAEHGKSSYALKAD